MENRFMCLIMFKEQADAIIPERIVESSSGKNGDSAGVMFVSSSRLFVDKHPVKGKEGVLEFTKKYLGEKNVAIHHRLSTQGSNCVKNTHPHPILNIDDGDPIDLAMMHNGVISGQGCSRANTDDDSDTRVFVEKFVKPILKLHPELLYTEAFQGMLAEFVGSANKLLFMDNQGRTVIINRQAGKDDEGVWYSNSGCHYTSCSYVRPANDFNRHYTRSVLPGKSEEEAKPPPLLIRGREPAKISNRSQEAGDSTDKGRTLIDLDALLKSKFTESTNLMNAIQECFTSKPEDLPLNFALVSESLDETEILILTKLLGPGLSSAIISGLAEEVLLDPLYDEEDELDEEQTFAMCGI